MVEHDMKNPTTLRHLHTSNRDDAQPEEACFQKRLAATIIRGLQSAVLVLTISLMTWIDFPETRYSGSAWPSSSTTTKRATAWNWRPPRRDWQHKAMLLVSRTHEAAYNDQRAITVIQDLLISNRRKLSASRPW